MSADDQSIVIMDTRSNDRTTFMTGLRGVPPIVQQATTMACSSVRNNGDRRFFSHICSAAMVVMMATMVKRSTLLRREYLAVVMWTILNGMIE